MSGLNASQQRYLAAVFAEVEKQVTGIAVATNSGMAFSAEEREKLRHFSAELRAKLQMLTAEFVQLPATDSNALRWQVHTLLEFALVELLGLTASKLRGYGELDAEAFARLMGQLTPLKHNLESWLRKC